MVVDIGFNGSRPKAAIPAPKPRTVPVMSADMKRMHERLSDITQRANTYKIDLDNAMSALQAANAEVDRLTAELGSAEVEMRRLNSEICMLRQELDKARQKKPKGKKPSDQGDAQPNS